MTEITQNYRYEDVLKFWFAEESKKRWFDKKDYFDKLILQKFFNLYDEATKGTLDYWKQSAEGALALIIIFDQFPRNMFRGQARSFATDNKALEITKYSLANGQDLELNAEYKQFLYMPLMHSENLDDQKLCVQLFENDPQAHNFALMHMRIIARFGKFPHRDNILGRKSTEEEIQFLTLPNSSF